MKRTWPRITFFLLFLLFGLLAAGLFGGDRYYCVFISEAVLLFFYLSASYFLTKEKKTRPAFRPGSFRYLYPLFFLLPLLTSSFAFLLSFLYGKAGLPLPTGQSLPLWVAVIASALLPAWEEELFFRGRLLPAFAPGAGGGSLLFSALSFSLLHADFSKMPYAFLAGLLLGAAAFLSGNWFFPFLLHFFNNLLSLLAEEGAFSSFLPLVLLPLFLLSLIPWLFPAYRADARTFFTPLFALLADKDGRKSLFFSGLRSPFWFFVAATVAVAVVRLL